MKKRILSIVIVMFVMLFSLTNVYATEGFFHLGAYNDIYKLSEQSEKISLPFVNIFSAAAKYDEAVRHSGISIADSTIDIDEKLEGVHVIFSNDMVTIKGEVENSFIYGNNVVIEGKISGDTLILSPNVQILDSAIVEKDVIVIANNLTIDGTVKGNVIATVSETADISGTIQKDLRMRAQDVKIDSSKIKGEIYLETNTNSDVITSKYPQAIVKPIVEDTTTEKEIHWMDIITKGITLTVVYTVVCCLATRKENNFVQRACKKFKENASYGIIASVILLILLIILPILLIVMAICGLGIIAWPVLIAYIGLILLVATTSTLIVGLAIFDAIKDKVGKLKIPTIALIYIVLYTLTQIKFISGYINMAMLLVALGIVVTAITKKMPIEVKEEKIETIESDKE